ncbi:MAG TPA: hypothetical protein PKV84_01640 [Candidatus Omnitrophota bacterium]|nr:hypothetical protein [Candidatus Omnitrophota bacterium]
MKLFRVFFLLLFFLFLPTILFADGNNQQQVPPGLNALVWEQGQIELEAYQLAKAGAYDAAIAKYHEALAPRFIYQEDRKCLPLYGIMNVHRLQGKFDQALQEQKWFLKMNPKKEEYKDDYLELKALAEAQRTKSSDPVRAYIQYLRDKYKDMLPPYKYVAVYVPIITSKIIFCYSWVGDADGGSAFIDGILKYFEQRDLKKYGKVRWGKGDNAYYKIKQAFEQDKAEGFKGCLDSKPGDACMGRATKALIQSNYFPW